MRLLIVDDEPDVAEVVAYGARMTWPGCDVVVAFNGQEALERLRDGQPDLVVLDIAMPPPDGFEVLRRIRVTSQQVPVIMLTARDATLDKIRALDLGADDYLTKPFDHLELIARLRALMRRATLLHTGPLNSGEAPPSPREAQHFVAGDLYIDYGTREVSLNASPVALTSTEYRLLEELTRSAGKTLTHSYLLEKVWGPEYVHEDHYLKVFVQRLRRKLGDDQERPRYIQTDWGIGYRFVGQRPNNGST